MLGNVFDIHSITIGDILFNLVKRIISISKIQRRLFFPVENNEIVLEKDITFYSMCEHHLMPFYGKAHLAYIPNGKVTGLSKLARTVEVYSRRPQIQERLTVQIADALERTLDPKGIMVMLEAEHTCMTMRGIKKPGSKTITTVTRGAFTEDKELQKMFLSMVKG